MPTSKQKKAAEILVEKGGSVSGAMVKAGFSKATAKTPKKLTESKGFKQILEQAGVTDDRLSQVLNEGLGATKIHSSHTEPDIEVPDHPTRHKYLETALKVKGHHSVEASGNTFNFVQVTNADKEDFFKE